MIWKRVVLVLGIVAGCLPSSGADERPRGDNLGRGPRQPGGLFGAELGNYRTIEGTPTEGPGKFEKGSVLVDTLDGKKLDKPVVVVVRRAGSQGGPLELPLKARFVIKGYETGEMIGVPPALRDKANEYGGIAPALGQVEFQWRPYFVALVVIEPKELKPPAKGGLVPGMNPPPANPPLDPLGPPLPGETTPAPKPPAMPAQPQPIAGDWSKPVNDLSARLLVTLEEIKAAGLPSSFRYQVMLELKNVGGEALSITNQPSFKDVEIRGSNGKKLPDVGLPQMGSWPLPQWAVIPSGSYMGVRVDMPAVATQRKVALLGVGGYTRYLEPGKYSFGATLVGPSSGRSPTTLWTGEIKLPPVSLTFKNSSEAPDGRSPKD